MDLRNLFLLGTAGYCILFIYDFAQLRKWTVLKRLCTIGFPLTALPYLGIWIYFNPSGKYSNFFVLFLMLMILALFILLLYSVLIEISLYYFLLRKNMQNINEEFFVYDKGTYSFSRHPGFIWYTGINICITILYLNSTVLILCLLVTFFNLCLIVYEDFFLFPRLFPRYNDYKKSVPFLL